MTKRYVRKLNSKKELFVDQNDSLVRTSYEPRVHLHMGKERKNETANGE